VIPYRKFSDSLKSEVGSRASPNPPKAPKVASITEVSAPSLGGLGTLGEAHIENQNFEPTPETTWTDTKDERAAIIEHDSGIPSAWAEALAQLDPNKPPSDVPPRRWLGFIDDCGRFLDGGWVLRATKLGWGPLDLFGCDRERPVSRVDHLGLVWLLNGGTVVELQRDRAILKTPNGALQSYRRRPIEVGRVVLAWALIS
jgi:hypothetical protein